MNSLVAFIYHGEYPQISRRLLLQDVDALFGLEVGPLLICLASGL
jgi:hypothetical protein